MIWICSISQQDGMVLQRSPQSATLFGFDSTTEAEVKGIFFSCKMIPTCRHLCPALSMERHLACKGQLWLPVQLIRSCFGFRSGHILCHPMLEYERCLVSPKFVNRWCWECNEKKWECLMQDGDWQVTLPPQPAATMYEIKNSLHCTWKK